MNKVNNSLFKSYQADAPFHQKGALWTRKSYVDQACSFWEEHLIFCCLFSEKFTCLSKSRHSIHVSV